jgi:hypothetical protein
MSKYNKFSHFFQPYNPFENLAISGPDPLLPDKAFNEWWTAKGFPPLQPGQVIPVMRAMQCHPESSRFWEKHINRIIPKYGFKPTVHEPCLYLGEVIEGSGASLNVRWMILQ